VARSSSCRKDCGNGLRQWQWSAARRLNLNWKLKGDEQRRRAGGGKKGHDP